MKRKAESFLDRAIESGSHLAAAPEWAYDVRWVTDHNESLFADDGPLFVLGCAPIQRDTKHRVIEELDRAYDVYEASEVSLTGEEFVTPTIVPISATARGDCDRDALLIQYKNHPMSDRIVANERANLVTGDAVWKINPRDAPSLVVWTCSDVMDFALSQDVQRYARRNDCIVVHVQCNPGPFHRDWITFRNELFNGEDYKTDYVCVNWGAITVESDANWFGYSGVYTKARSRPPLKKYDRTYENGGLVGTKPDCRCDYLWLMADDAVSRVRFSRPDPAAAGAGAPSFALPHVRKTWEWDANETVYTVGTPGVPECDADVCEEWRERLPDSPRDRQLLTTLTAGRIDFDRIDGGTVTPSTDLRWGALEPLTDTTRSEHSAHALVTHGRRPDDGPDETADRLVGGLKTANDHDIRLTDGFSIDDTPMNATYENRPIDICLVVRENERRAATQLDEWIGYRSDDLFKPVAVTFDHAEGAVLQTLDGYEDVARGSHDHEDVTTTGELVRIDS